ncbi:hypothetical protein KUTeg_021785 [Tegillarca granosa]|uniref:Uncharacterized protein n=1 Tax=Tegillarca granosa TaxID=220873 RepID=A0ABQ9E8Z9_TEGGR|nr:hypothetical protein KUTeg_021785 [Tegillarca granosa]
MNPLGRFPKKTRPYRFPTLGYLKPPPPPPINNVPHRFSSTFLLSDKLLSSVTHLSGFLTHTSQNSYALSSVQQSINLTGKSCGRRVQARHTSATFRSASHLLPSPISLTLIGLSLSADTMAVRRTIANTEKAFIDLI